MKFKNCFLFFLCAAVVSGWCPAASALGFSASPSDAELATARVFDEPLVPLNSEPNAAENQALAQALAAYSQRTTADDCSSLADFAANFPQSRWTASLLLHLGVEYYNYGYFSKALDAWQRSWEQFRINNYPPAKPQADRALGELARMQARIGRAADLSALLDSTKDRDVGGPGSQLVHSSSEALWLMQNKPDYAFGCGPSALDRILLHFAPSKAGSSVLLDCKSGTNGFSLTEVADISKKLGMNYQMAYRQPGAPLIVPSVVHWKIDHYGAVIEQRGDRVLVQDYTFIASLWVSERALNEETSGYFLVPQGKLPAGWRAVSAVEGQTIRGRGQTTTRDPKANVPCTDKSSGGSSCPKCNPCDNCKNKAKGMTTYTMHALLTSLSLEDTPVSFQSPIGPEVAFTANYNQTEADQPATFYYSNLGPLWDCSFLSYVTDNPTSPGADLSVYMDGGGELDFNNFNPTAQTYAAEALTQAVLVRLSTNSYVLQYPDGSRRKYSQSDGATGSTRRIFLTQRIDPSGNTVQFNYDGQLRITNIVNAIGQTMTLGYTNSAYPFQITSATDPFGRSAQLLYNANGLLIQITDVLGLISQYTYGANQFITNLTTPYGTTTFTTGATNGGAYLTATDPLGGTEAMEYSQSLPVTDSLPAPQVPHGLSTFNLFLSARDSFYWNKKAFAEGAWDWSKAHIYHWLHQSPSGNDSARILESEKDPLESRVYYNYPGEYTNLGAPYYLDAAYTGASGEPSIVARVLADGTTQLYEYGYNAAGNITNLTDPVGRTFTAIYSTNNIDALETRMTRNGQNQLLRRATYNAQHQPVTVTDASGQTFTNTYNAQGQLISSINPLGEMTTLSYSSNSYLVSITGPLQNGSDVTSFTYDGFGRIRTMTDTEGYTLVYDYDALDRTTRITHPDGTYEQFVYTFLDQTASRDRLGRWSTNVYNSDRQLVQTMDPLGRLTRFDWRTCGSLTSLTDPLGRTTTWRYDLQSRLVEGELYPDGSSVNFQYDANTGRLTVRTDEKGQQTVYDYYHDNHLKSVTYPNAMVATPTVVFAYDPDYDRLQSMTDGMGMTTYAYNPVTPSPALGAGRLQSISGPLPNSTVSFEYDQLGRPFGRGINGADETLSFDNLDRPNHVTNPLGSFTYAYVDATTRLAVEGCPNGQTNSYSYYGNPGDERLQRILHLKPDGSLLSSFGLTYNSVGALVACTNAWDALPTRVWMYGYDAADQLTTAVETDGVNPITPYTYAYDSAGNRTVASSGATTNHFFFNALNEVIGSDVVPSGGFTYEWDGANRLSAINQGGGRTEFSYDGVGARSRIVEKTNGIVNSDNCFLWCGTELCEQRDATGSNVIRRFFPQGEAIVGPGGGTNLYYTRDHLDSIRETMDGHGTLMSRYDYDPFGTPISLVGILQPAFAFGGYYFHQPSGLSLAFYRALNHQSGRWLSRDPLGESIAYNQYTYVGNNPVNWLDPLGLYAEVVVDGDKVTITIPIEYQGAGVTPEVAAKFTEGIQNQWTGKFGKYNVTVKVTTPAADCPAAKKNVIQVPTGNTRAYVNAGGQTGRWPSERPAWTAAHEAGHLMGLPDRYDEATGTANAGYENDIMGTRDKPPSETDITQIIEANKGK